MEKRKVLPSLACLIAVLFFSFSVLTGETVKSAETVNGSESAEITEFTIDFSSPEVAAAIRSCPFARVEDDTLFVDVPPEKGMWTAMIRIPLGKYSESFKGFIVITEADVCFSNIPKPAETYFGAKYQLFLKNRHDNQWPSLIRRPDGNPPWGSMEWSHHCAWNNWTDEVTEAGLELGIQGSNGHFAIKNIRFRRGKPCPVSTLSLDVIPQAKYSVHQMSRMRGVMSPSTVNDPREEDFAEIEKWGANLIRWQMGLPRDIENVDVAKKSLWGRFAQIEKVLEMARRHHLHVVLDVHTMHGARKFMMGTPEGRELLVEFWQEVARRFGGDPNIFGFNLMNEPVSDDIEMDGPTLNEQYHRLIRAIREIDSKTPIILDCDGAGRPETLEFLEVFPYENIIYSPHFYKPFELTHQLNQDQTKFLGYPNPERGWDKEFLRSELARVREFQLKTGCRIYIGEFSCIRWAPGAENFLKDSIELFEEYGWDWSYHAFREFQGWNAEFSGPPKAPRTDLENPRLRVLKDGFRLNRARGRRSVSASDSTVSDSTVSDSTVSDSTVSDSTVSDLTNPCVSDRVSSSVSVSTTEETDTNTASLARPAFQMTREIVQELPPQANNPRNSEGDFVRLNDGRILFVYSMYFGQSAGDHAHANLAQIVSSDEGKTWSQPEVIVRMDGGMNVMSVSLLRLKDGRIGLFYLRKFAMDDCREWVRFSKDEGKTWSEAVCCMEDKDYFVVNNARIVQLRDGTILVPAALHHFKDGRNDFSGEALCFISTDDGKTFKRGEQAVKPKGMIFQEPGVVEMEDGTIFMHVRTNSGSQFSMKSTDSGLTWGPAAPTCFTSPCSPMLIRPIPETDRFLAVWNNSPRERNPLTLAVLDSSLSILWRTTLDHSEGTPPQRFCYPAILALGENSFLISYCAGIMPNAGLEKTRIVKVTLSPTP